MGGRDVYVGEMRGSVLKELKKELQRKLKKEAIEVEETQHVVLGEKEALERERHEEALERKRHEEALERERHEVEPLGEQTDEVEPVGEQTDEVEPLGEQTDEVERLGEQTDEVERLGEQTDEVEPFGEQTDEGLEQTIQQTEEDLKKREEEERIAAEELKKREEEELRIEEERLAKIAKVNEKEKMEQCENEKGALTKKLQLKDHADLLSPEGTNWDDLDKLRGEINLFKTSCQDVSVEDLEIGLEKEKDKREEIKKQRDTATTTLDAAGGIDAIRNWLKSEDNTKFNDLKESAREKVKKKCENKLGKIKKIVDDVKTRIESLKKGGEPEADFWYEEALLETGQEPSIYCDREAATNFADYGKQLEKEQGTMQGVIKTRRQTKDEIIKAKKVEDMVVWLEKPYAEFTDLVEKAKDKKEELIKHWEEKANKALEAMDTPEKAESWLQNEDFLQFPELVTKAKHKQAKIALEEAESSDDRVG